MLVRRAVLFDPEDTLSAGSQVSNRRTAYSTQSQHDDIPICHNLLLCLETKTCLSMLDSRERMKKVQRNDPIRVSENGAQQRLT